MANTYYTILTSTGLAALTNAMALGQTVDLTELAVGDGGGEATAPTEASTELVNEVWRGVISNISVHAENPNWLEIEAIIPAGEGGWYVREAGVYDDNGNLIMVGNFPETYKPELAEGSSKDLLVKLIMETTNVDVVNLLVDPSVVLANRGYVDDMMTAHLAGEEPFNHTQFITTDQMAAHLAGENPYEHTTYLTKIEGKLLKIYPEIDTPTNKMAISNNGDGSITIDGGQEWRLYGWKKFTSDDYDIADLTFVHAANKTYHLRWSEADGFSLKDLSDINYNPGLISETDASFDTGYDDMLVARIVTDGGNAVTITALTNASSLAINVDLSTAIVNGIGSPFDLVLNWSRRALSAIALRGFKNTYHEFNEGIEGSGSTMREVAVDDGGTDNRYGASLTSYYNDTIGNSGRVWINWYLEA